MCRGMFSLSCGSERDGKWVCVARILSIENVNIIKDGRLKVRI